MPRARDLKQEAADKMAEYQARYRAEVRRQEAKWEFEQFCRAQRRRVALTLDRTMARLEVDGGGDTAPLNFLQARK